MSNSHSSSLPPICVRTEGRCWTVFIDGNGQPVPFSDFNAPPLEFPFTTSPEGIQARFPGREFHLIKDPQIPPQPDSRPLTPVQEKALVKMVSEIEGKKQGTIQVQPQPTQSTIEPLAQLAAHLIASFEGYAREQLADGHANAVEEVGTFLLNTFPDLEGELLKAGERAKAPVKAQRKAFKLG